MTPGILLMNFGGPPVSDQATIRRYIENILTDPANWPWRRLRALQPAVARTIAARRAPAVVAQYATMNGGSPLLSISEEQRTLLQQALNGAGARHPIFLGMQYWPPLIEEVLPQVRSAGLTDLLLLPLYPHDSVATSETCCERVERWWRLHGDATVRLHRCTGWYSHPRYIACCAKLLSFTLSQCEHPAKTTILFTAHGLPQAIVDGGDPYPHQVRAQIGKILSEGCLANPWLLGFQSRLGPVRWLTPDIEPCLKACAALGVRSLCIMPLSFVAEQLETLYEIDVTYVEMARRFGIAEVRRVPCANTDPLFIDSLKDLIIGHNYHV
ncbi:MAG: ferrochelatase [Deltaproteobacteria bacterium]|nr:ferrochelatase [Deltaproteobacteria bacterium]